MSDLEDQIKPFDTLDDLQQIEVLEEINKINKYSSSKDVIYHLSRALYKIRKYSSAVLEANPTTPTQKEK